MRAVCLVLSLILLSGCSSFKNKESEFVGIWTSVDMLDMKLTYNSDGSGVLNFGRYDEVFLWSVEKEKLEWDLDVRNIINTIRSDLGVNLLDEGKIEASCEVSENGLIINFAQGAWGDEEHVVETWHFTKNEADMLWGEGQSPTTVAGSSNGKFKRKVNSTESEVQATIENKEGEISNGNVESNVGD